MEDNFTQRFQFATITPYADYSKLSNKPNTLNTFDYVNDDIFGFPTSSHRKESHREGENFRVTSLPDYNPKRKVFFFTEKKDVKDNFKIYSLIKKSKTNGSFDTTKDSQIKRHYGRAFSDIIIHTLERSIKKNGDNVTIKSYVSYRHRGFNCIYFKKITHITSLTFNLKTGNITTFESTTGGKRKTSKIRKNSFQFIYGLLFNNYSFLRLKNLIDKNSRLYNQTVDEFDDVAFTSHIQGLLKITPNHIDYNSNPTSFILDIIDLFVKKKQIKIPDGNITRLITKFYPTEKYLKKNDRKLIASVLDMLGIKSKVTIKFLHLYPNLNLTSLKWLCSVLGSNFTKYISNLDDRVFKYSSKGSDPFSYAEQDSKGIALNRYNTNTRNIFLSDIEKENLIKILNSECETQNHLREDKLDLLVDHFMMIDKVREYDPEIYMRAKTYQEFSDEHRELSKMIAAIKKGWVIEYQYDQKTIDEIEEPLDYIINIGIEDEPVFGIDMSKNGEKLYPHILKREEEYVEEGSFMHHCVASYADKDKSMIVSVRSENQQDRVTIEYDIQSGKPLQKRYFCNAVPPDYFTYALALVDERIKKLARWGLLNWKEKKKVNVKINGIEVVPQNNGPRTFADLLTAETLMF